MSSYPVNLDLANKKCAVIGGGHIAARKAGSLLQAQADVTVISPKLVDEKLARFAKGNLLEYIARGYEKGDLQGFFIVICASDDHEVNKMAAQEAKEQGALVNVADGSFPSDFTLPATVKRGQFLLTVSTGGLSPAFSVLVKKELEEKYNDNYVEFLQVVADLRTRLKGELKTSKQREALWHKMMTKDILELVEKGNLSEAKVRLENAVSRFRTEP